MKFTRKNKIPLIPLVKFHTKKQKTPKWKKKNWITSKLQNIKIKNLQSSQEEMQMPPLCPSDTTQVFFLKNPKLITRILKFSKISTYPNKKPSTAQEERQIIITKGKVSLYIKWFHWILNEFTGCNERGLVKKQWIRWL